MTLYGGYKVLCTGLSKSPPSRAKLPALHMCLKFMSETCVFIYKLNQKRLIKLVTRYRSLSLLSFAVPSLALSSTTLYNHKNPAWRLMHRLSSALARLQQESAKSCQVQQLPLPRPTSRGRRLAASTPVSAIAS